VGKRLVGNLVVVRRHERLVEENDPWLRALGAAYDRISCPVLVVVGSRPDRVAQRVEIRETVRRGVHALKRRIRR
jgi:hypothetical protein